jgi:hypothetical protein
MTAKKGSNGWRLVAKARQERLVLAWAELHQEKLLAGEE